MSTIKRRKLDAFAHCRSPRTLLAAAALCAVLAPGSGFTADQPIVNEKFADLEPAIQMLRSEVGKDRREIVKNAMLLTESEGKTFWPLYDEYRGKIHKLGDRRVRLITDFAANRNAMSEDEAAKLTQEALSIDKDRISVKEDYVKKMSKVLSARTVARFFQIDSKLDAVVDAQLAAQIPLIH
ncbi:MAG TPA: hypothetical protein VEK10_03540 [Steroidobacteraceae bacterium]|nr:hypothetical protein [Steroidobacteraceae bacterium]